MEQQQKDRLAVSVAEAAEALGISRSSLYAEIKQGRIRTVKLAGRLLVPWAELAEMVTLPARDRMTRGLNQKASEHYPPGQAGNGEETPQ